jgi:hypothetical protein
MRLLILIVVAALAGCASHSYPIDDDFPANAFPTDRGE